MGQTAHPLLIEERYCEVSAKRLSQEVLDFGVNDPESEPRQITISEVVPDITV